MESLVSVIIPTYNRADYLKLALKSVIEQTYKNIEVIVVDDGSTDHTAEVIASFNNSRIKYFYQENTGLPAAGRNLGLRECSGAYIAFLDSDDMWHPEKLEKQVRYLCEHPQYYLVYSNAWIIDDFELQKGLLLKSGTLKQGKIFRKLINGNFIPVMTVLMRREVFENVGFFNEDYSIRAAEDYEYWLRIALHYKFGFIDEPLAMYRKHSGSTISKANSAQLGQKVLSLFLNNPHVPDGYKKDIVAEIHELYYQSAWYYWSKSEKLLAKKELKKYLSYNFRHVYLINVFKALCFWVLFNFDYHSSKTIRK